jgi:hypothetical protein
MQSGQQPDQVKSRRYACHCCGYFTFDEDPTDTFNICPVCFWEHAYPEIEEGPNGVSLAEAKENFKQLGACHEKDVQFVRGPLPEEEFEEWPK